MDILFYLCWNLKQLFGSTVYFPPVVAVLSRHDADEQALNYCNCITGLLLLQAQYVMIMNRQLNELSVLTKT